ncbi:hypothetical protein Tco_0353396 [Tanacetum coccineum]
MADTRFVQYTGIEVQHFRDTLLQHLGNVKKSVAERTRHQRQYERRVNKRQMQTQESKIDTGKALDADLVDTESIRTDSIVQDDSSRSGNDTDADDADISPYMTKSQMLRVDQYPEKCQVKSPMLDSSPDNQTTEYSKQSLESENILLKKTVAQFQKDFSRMEAHSKIKRDMDEIETINIDLEHSVTKLLTQNKHLNKENETLKKHYKDLYDSIEITRSKTIEQTTFLLAKNADLKAQIQEKVFAIAALKNDLRKLKRNSVDTKFAKTSVLGKPVLQSLRNQSVVRQPNAFKSERPQMSKQRFASQVDVNNNLSRPMKLGKRHKKVIGSARFQSTADGSKPKPRSNNQTPRSLPVSKSSCVTITVVPKADHSKSSSSFLDSKQFVCSTCHKCVFNANHDACITKLLKEVNSRAKIQSHKTRNSNKPVDQKSHTQKPGRQIFTRHRFSPNKTSVVYEKTSPRSDLRWKPTGRIFKSVGLRWIPTGKLFDSCTSKVDSEPTHGSNVDIPNIHESKQTLDLSAGTSINVQKEQSFDLSAGTSNNVKPDNLRVWLLKKLISQKPVSQWIHQMMKQKYGRFESQQTSPQPQCKTTFKQNGSSLAPQCQQEVIKLLSQSYALSWKPCQGDSLNLPDHRAQVDQGSQIKMIQVKEMMQDNDLKNLKSKDKGSKSRSQSMDEQSHYKQDKTITRQSINVKRHIFNVIGDTEKFEERDLNIGGDC